MQKDLIVLLGMLSVFFAILSASFPFIMGDNSKSRLKAIRSRRESMKKQFSVKTEKVISLRERLNKQTTFGKISDKLNLKKFFNMEKLKNKLLVAGWRDSSTLPKFLVLNILTPFMLTGVVYWMIYMGPFKNNFPYPTFKPLVVLAGCLLGYYLPTLMLNNAIEKRGVCLTQQFPDALDLLLVCIEAGLSVDTAMMRVSVEMNESLPEISEEFEQTGAELALLGDRPQCYRNLIMRTERVEGFKQLANAMSQSDQYGSSMAASLRAMSEDARKHRTIEIEKKASSLNTKMTIPMIVFILPCMFLILLGPVVVNVLGIHKNE